MNARLARAVVLFACTAIAAGLATPAVTFAQSAAEGAAAGGFGAAADSASQMIYDAIQERKAEREAAQRAAVARRQAQGVIGQATPAPSASAAATPAPFDDLETPRPGFNAGPPYHQGITGEVDLNSSYAAGDTGFHSNSLPGGLDATLYVQPWKTTRLQAGLYSTREYPIGNDTGIVPSYISFWAEQGNAGTFVPGRTICQNIVPPGAKPGQLGINLHGVPGGENCPTNLGSYFFNGVGGNETDATLNTKLGIISLQKLFYLTLPLPGQFSGGVFNVPFVIAVNYNAFRGGVGGGDDVYLAWDPNRGTYHTVHIQSAEQKSALLAIPLAASPKLFATYEIGPSWNVNTNGNNQENTATINQIFDLRYYATPSTTIFFQPSRISVYFPQDPYPQRLPLIITGLNHRIGGPESPVFIQAYVAEGTAQNPPYGQSGRLGVVDLTCVKNYPFSVSPLTPGTCTESPNPRTNVATLFGGDKISTFYLDIGIGKPAVAPI